MLRIKFSGKIATFANPQNVCVLNQLMIQYEKNAVQKMEDFQVFSFESGGRAKRLADSIQNNKKEMDFRKRLSGVVWKFHSNRPLKIALN